MSDKIVHATQASFQSEVVQSAIPVVVDFWAPWCGPCRAVGPVLEKLADRYAGRVKVVKVNVDEEPGVATAFQVSGIPTIVGIKGGRIAAQQVGFQGQAALEQMFDQLTAGAQS